MTEIIPLAFEYGLEKLDAARRAVAIAKTVDEAMRIRDDAERLRVLAKVAKDKQIEIDGTEIRFRAERRIGEQIAAQKQTVGLAKPGRPKIGSMADPISTPGSLAEAGIDKHLADRARKLAAVPEDNFEEKIADWRVRVEEKNEPVTLDLLNSHVRGTLGTGENEWHTPSEHLEAARAVLGKIDLDPASSDLAQGVVKAGAHFTKKDSGLDHEWNGAIWLNPPYAQPLIAQFVDKLLAEIEAGRVTSAIMLTHNYTDTAWFQSAAARANAICFTRGRIRFIDPKGELAAPTQGQAFFYFGDKIADFAMTFAPLGFVVPQVMARCMEPAP